MSWNPFASEEVTRVATQVTRVVADDAIPDPVKAGLVKSLFQDSSVADTIMDELAHGIGVRAERMYRYAKDNYAYGLPSGRIYSSTQGRLEVEAVIESQIEHQQVAIDYSHYGVANALHIGWTKLYAEHGYDSATNKLGHLSAQLGKDVYLKDMVVVVPADQMETINPGRVVQWGMSARTGYTPERPAGYGVLAGSVEPSPVHTSTTATEIKVEVIGVWAKPATQLLLQDESHYVEERFQITLAGYDMTANYFHVKYEMGGQPKYWMYKYGSGTYPSLDQVYVDAPVENGSYFPMTYFRYGKRSMADDYLSNGYKTSKKMLNILGVNYDSMVDNINSNPEVENVEQAIMFFGVPSVSTNPQENRYLFDYFDAQHDAIDGTGSITEASVAAALQNQASFGTWSAAANTVIIQDAMFKIALGNNGIFKHVVAGSIGDIDTYSSSFETINIQQESVDVDSGGVTVYTYPIKMHRYRHQITTGLYEEIVVSGLRMTYYVYGNYTTGGDDVSDTLMVPIDRSISELYSIKDRQALYTRSLHLIFNSRVTQEIKWYQQEWFRVALIVVAIVLTIVDGGTDGGSWISEVLGLTGTEAVVATVIFKLVVGLYIMPKAFSLFVKAFGQEAAEIVAVALIIYGGYSLMQNGMAGLPTAGDMLMLSTGLEGAVIQAKFGDLATEYNQMSEWEKTQQAELDRANELLSKETILSPFVIFGEKPEDFYNRTIHFGNIGTLGINAVSSYVDIALTLPKINDTLGEPING
jgi:hypothetical protein